MRQISPKLKLHKESFFIAFSFQKKKEKKITITFPSDFSSARLRFMETIYSTNQNSLITKS